MKFSILVLGLVVALLGAVAPSPVMASGRTVLKVNIVRGFVTVYVNSRRVGRFGKADIYGSRDNALLTRDVSSLVKPGKNALRAVWNEKQFPVGDVHISFAARSGPGAAFRELAKFDFNIMAKPRDDKTVFFNLPDSRGSLSSSRNTAGSQGRRAQGSSRTHQTLLVANVARGDITIWVNGRQIGNYSSGLLRLDVSNYVKGGANELRLSWQKTRLPIGQISVAYAPQKNAFRTVAKYDFGLLTSKSPSGSKVIFKLPASANR